MSEEKLLDNISGRFRRRHEIIVDPFLSSNLELSYPRRSIRLENSAIDLRAALEANLLASVLKLKNWLINFSAQRLCAASFPF